MIFAAHIDQFGSYLVFDSSDETWDALKLFECAFPNEFVYISCYGEYENCLTLKSFNQARKEYYHG